MGEPFDEAGGGGRPVESGGDLAKLFASCFSRLRVVQQLLDGRGETLNIAVGNDYRRVACVLGGKRDQVGADQC